MTLYSSTVLEHFRHPRNRGSLAAPDLAHEGLNPLCGDRIRIEVALHDGVVEEARFRGDACAICIAATSILTGMLRGATVAELEAIADETLLGALDADIPAGRRQCALLPLEVLRAAMRPLGRPA